MAVKPNLVLFHDVETRGRLDLKNVGAHKYAADSETDVLCVAYAIGDGPIKLWTPGEPVPAEFKMARRDDRVIVAHNRIIVAHNASFERTVARHILVPRYGFPEIPLSQWRCSMAQAYACALPGKLETVAEALGLTHQKDAEGAGVMRKLCKPNVKGEWNNDPELLQRLYEYCRNDVACERDLFKALPALHPDEQRLWEIDQTINERGFYTDGELIKASRHVVAESESKLLTEFHELTELDSPAQVAKLIAWLADHGCEVDDLRKVTLARALTRKDLSKDVRRAIEIRRALAHASAAKVESLRAWRNDDGRVRGALIYHGAATGRWVGRGPQPQNFKRDTAGTAEKITAILAGGDGLESPVEAVGEIARAMIAAAPNHRLMVADFSGVESRVLAWISGEQSKLDMWAKFDRSQAERDDPYYVIGRAIGHTESKARALGKMCDLAFGYQGGVGAWKNFAPEDDASDEATIEHYRDAWRQAHPETVKFWTAVDRAAIRAVRRSAEQQVGRLTFRFEAPFLRVTLPSGRALTYPFPEIRQNRFGKSCLSFKDNAGGKFVDVKFGQGAYGGIFTENIVSGIARDLLAAALIRLEAAGYFVTLHIHDEIVVEVADDFGAIEEFRRLVETAPPWSVDLPIYAKARESARFSKDDAEARASSAPSPQDDAASDDEGDESDRNSPTVSTERVEPAVAMSAPTLVEMLQSSLEFAESREAPQAREPQSNGQDPDESFPHRKREGNGSRAETARDTHAEDHADRRFSDLHLRRHGYALARVFDYTLPDGTLLYQQNRYELKPNRTPSKDHPRKRFLVHRIVDDKDVFGSGPRRIIYQWPAIMRAAPGSNIFVAEGEANADALINAGHLATTVLSHHWAPECIAALTGHHLIILEDADEDGRKLAAAAQIKLAPVAASIRIVPAAHLWKHLELPGQEPPLHADVEDWLAAGGDPAKLAEICHKVLPEGTKLTFIDMSRWDAEPAPEQEWAVYNRIPRRECVLFSGEGGAGKSILQLQQCCASTLSREWLGVVPEQGPAIFIDAEDDDRVLHRRTKAIADHYEVSIAELIRSGLHLVSWRGIDATLAVPERSGKMEPTALYRQLLEAAGDIKPIMIGIAASANVFAGNENDRAQVQQFIGLLTRVAMVANGSITLISHPSLAGINSETGLSGSTQWHNSVRARQFLRGVKPEGGEPVDHDLRECVFKKNNYGPISESIILRWSDGLFLPVPGATIDQAARETTASHVFLALLDRFLAANRDVSDKLGANYAPAAFSKEDEAKLAKLNKQDLERAMRQLFRDGRIINELRPGCRPARPSYRIVPVRGA